MANIHTFPTPGCSILVRVWLLILCLCGTCSIIYLAITRVIIVYDQQTGVFLAVEFGQVDSWLNNSQTGGF